jgi:hypothetical protein
MHDAYSWAAFHIAAQLFVVGCFQPPHEVYFKYRKHDLYFFAVSQKHGAIMKDVNHPGKRKGRYIPKYYVFCGFHLSTCYP